MKEEDKIDFLNNIIFLLPDCFALEVKRFIACQFALESAFGSSPFAKCRHNYCGMKVPALRLSLVSNPTERGEFASYSGITYCVHDYLLWLASNKFTKEQRYDLYEFIKHLQYSGYCPESDYISKIQTIYSKYYE